MWSLSHVQLFATPWTVASQASLSIEFSRQEYWSGLPFPSPEKLPNPETEPWSPASQAEYLPFELQGSLVWLTFMLNLPGYLHFNLILQVYAT